MAGKRSSFFSHRSLVSIEAMLAVGVLKVWLEQFILDWHTLAGWLRIIMLMLLAIGLFSSLFLLIEHFVQRSLVKSRRLVHGLPLPWPLMIVHGAIIAGLFLLYAVVYAIPWQFF